MPQRPVLEIPALCPSPYLPPVLEASENVSESEPELPVYGYEERLKATINAIKSGINWIRGAEKLFGGEYSTLRRRLNGLKFVKRLISISNISRLKKPFW